jgi:uncharacterized HAD superfamily protein
MKFYTYDDLNDCICKNISRLPRDIDLVVGVPRSGMIPAYLIGLYLNVPVMDLNSFLEKREVQTGHTRIRESWVKSAAETKHTLIVDDGVGSGLSMEIVKDKVNARRATVNVTYCAIYSSLGNHHYADIRFEALLRPCTFEWNYFHSGYISKMCVDIDGVLCENPEFGEDTDLEYYEKFLVNATPRFIPTKRVGYLVTGRNEIYRQQTETWLRLHNVEYDHLIMMTPEEKAGGAYGEFKARIYKSTNCNLFLESEIGQALTICELSGKQVFCVGTRRLITPENLSDRAKIFANELSVTFYWRFMRRVKKILGKRLSAKLKKVRNSIRGRT